MSFTYRCGLHLSVFLSLAVSTWASWPPLQDIHVWEDGEKIRYEVYDPIRQDWIRGSSRMSDSAFNGLTTRDGIAYWTAVEDISGETTVAFVIYDPIRGEWRTHDKDMKQHGVSYLSSRDGVVTWLRTDTIQHEKSVFYVTYNPRLERWERSQTDFDGETIEDLITKDGVVAWVENDSGGRRVHFTIYDPVNEEWVRGYKKHGSHEVEALEIRESSVHWHYDEDKYERGYDIEYHDWDNDATKAYADFTVSKTFGDPPLYVLFFDMSIGGLSWEWDFGNGDWSPYRNEAYTYTEPGVYELAQIVYGAANTSVKSITIQTGESQPTPTPTGTAAPTVTPTPTIPPAPGLASDINRDGIVDRADLLFLQSEWHQGERFTPTPAPNSPGE